MRLLGILAVAFISATLLAGCATRANFIKTELYFGLNVPDGSRVEDPDFELFIDTCLTPRFPDGLTIIKAQGQWRDTSSQKVDKEDSRMVILVYPRKSRKAKNALIEQVRTSYQKAFNQQAVMRVDMQTKTSF